MARCVSFPSVVKQGMLFVWPDETGHDLAEKTSPPITAGIALLRLLYYWFTTDPYSSSCSFMPRSLNGAHFYRGRNQALDVESMVMNFIILIAILWRYGPLLFRPLIGHD